MGEVFLNGEIVDFQGPAPATAIEAWTLLEQFLGQSGLLIERMGVDGQDWTPGGVSDSATYRKIEVFSVTQEDKVSQIVAELLRQGPALEERWSACSRQVLSRPWVSFQKHGIELLNDTQPLVQSLGLLHEYAKGCQAEWGPSLGRATGHLNVELGSLLDAFEAGDCVVFSDVAESGILAGLQEIFRVLNDEVASGLESGMTE